MATSQNLVVNMIAKTAAFEKGMSRSRTSISRLSKGVAAARRAMGRMMKVISVASIAAAMGIGYMVKKQMEQIDVTTKLAKRLKMSTVELVGLQHAASIGGMTTEGMNKAIETFVRRLGEMRMGVGQAKYALEAMGVSQETLIRMRPAEAFRYLADRINLLSTQADKAAASYYLFGRQGMLLLNVMEQGSKGLIAMREEAKKLRITFTLLEGTAVENANDAITRLKSVFMGATRALTIQLAPALELLANKLTKMGTTGQGFAGIMVRSMRAVGLSILEVTERIYAAQALLRLGWAKTRPIFSMSEERRKEMRVERDEAVRRFAYEQTPKEKFVNVMDKLLVELVQINANTRETAQEGGLM